MGDDGQVCCILGVCCPPGSPAQFKQLTALVLKSRPRLSQALAEAAAQRVLDAHNNFSGVAAAIDAKA